MVLLRASARANGRDGCPEKEETRTERAHGGTDTVPATEGHRSRLLKSFAGPCDPVRDSFEGACRVAEPPRSEGLARRRSGWDARGRPIHAHVHAGRLRRPPANGGGRPDPKRPRSRVTGHQTGPSFILRTRCPPSTTTNDLITWVDRCS